MYGATQTTHTSILFECSSMYKLILFFIFSGLFSITFLSPKVVGYAKLYNKNIYLAIILLLIAFINFL